MSEIQSVIFDRDKFNLMGATNWLKSLGLKVKKIDIPKSGNTLRFRQRPPKYEQYINREVDDGVKLIIGYKKILIKK